MRKIPNFTEKTLRTVVFGINQHQAQDGSGSPSERFFKRHIRSGLPSIIKKELQHEDLMKIRAEKQQKAAKKKGKLSADTFKLEDEVWIQNAANKRWDKTGCIKEIRQSDDRQDVSFVISLANGRETIRHRSHPRHNITRYTKVTDRRVRFNLKENTEGEDKDKEKKELKKRGRPRKLEKTKSANDCETVPV